MSSANCTEFWSKPGCFHLSKFIYMGQANADDDESLDELLELLTCHRSAPCLPLPRNNHVKLAVLWGDYHSYSPETKVTDGPFPWKLPVSCSTPPCNAATDLDSRHAIVTWPASAPARNGSSNGSRSDRHQELSRRLQSRIAECETRHPIVCRVDGSSLHAAGKALNHAIQVMEGYFLKHSPLIFKIGITHDPIFRWANDVYGYGVARDSWAEMVVLYLSDEPYSPAMLEAALIEKYQSSLSAPTYRFHEPLMIFFWLISLHKCFHIQGRPGCRNIAKGGEGIMEQQTSEDLFMTYMVYRSFKYPPSGPYRRIRN